MDKGLHLLLQGGYQCSSFYMLAPLPHVLCAFLVSCLRDRLPCCGAILVWDLLVGRGVAPDMDTCSVTGLRDWGV